MDTPRTMPALLEEGARRFGNLPAIVDGERRLTYAELAETARTAARAYAARGVRLGDRVAIWAPNRAEYAVALLGAQVMGAAVVPLNTRYRGHEARVVLERSRASALVVTNGFLGTDFVEMLAGSAGDDRRPRQCRATDAGAARPAHRSSTSATARTGPTP